MLFKMTDETMMKDVNNSEGEGLAFTTHAWSRPLFRNYPISFTVPLSGKKLSGNTNQALGGCTCALSLCIDQVLS